MPNSFSGALASLLKQLVQQTLFIKNETSQLVKNILYIGYELTTRTLRYGGGGRRLPATGLEGTLKVSWVESKT